MPDDNGKKTFFSVIGMSDEWRKIDGAIHKNGTVVTPEMELQIWNIRMQLAQAQQLTMISESLKKLTEKMVGQ